MQVNPYGEDPVKLAVRLANDFPRTVSELKDRCLDAGMTVDGRLTRRDLELTAEVIDEWLTIVDAAAEETRAERLNAMLAHYAAHPRLTDHSGGGWHIHFRDDKCSAGQVLAVIIATGTAFHLAGRGMHRLGRCADPGCCTVFADLSRTGLQRYCCLRCNNRDAVRRHRARAGVGAGRSSLGR